MKTLTVFYDANCGMCCAVRKWMTSRPAYISLRFIALQDKKARDICPTLDEYHPEREIVAMGDRGEIYTGGKAWVMCLWALREYRELSLRMGSPLFLPLAKRVCNLISKNRMRLSRWFFRGGAKAAEKEVERIESEHVDTCENGICGLPPKIK